MGLGPSKVATTCTDFLRAGQGLAPSKAVPVEVRALIGA